MEAVKTNSYYGTRARYYKYGYFQCSGDEQSILNCQKSENMDASYIQKYAAGVKCTKKHYGSNLTLQNGRNDTEGGLIFFNGRPVCEDSWDMKDANVTCHQLGFKHVQHIIGKSFGGSVDLPYSMLDVQCVGDENTLSDCVHLKANESYYCKEKNAAGVHCTNIITGIPSE